MTTFKAKTTSLPVMTSFNYTDRNNTRIHWLKEVNKYLE